MPVECQMLFQPCDRGMYHEIDHLVRGVAFEIHNDFGWLLTEGLYKRELVTRCARRGITLCQEVRFQLRYGQFQKDYSADIVAEQRVIIECKTTDRLAPAHKAQLQNYLYLSGNQWGTLINFGSIRVQHEYTTTSLTAVERRRVIYNEALWKVCGPACVQMRGTLRELLADWGAFLEVTVYRDALCHLIPGAGPQSVPFYSGNSLLGTQPFYLLSEDVALIITAATRDTDAMRSHHMRLLRHTRLRAIQWVNFNQHTVHLETLTRTH